MKMENPFIGKWIYYLCIEYDYNTIDAQNFIKDHPEVIESSPPKTTNEKHLERAILSEALSDKDLVIYD